MSLTMIVHSNNGDTHYLSVQPNIYLDCLVKTPDTVAETCWSSDKSQAVQLTLEEANDCMHHMEGIILDKDPSMYLTSVANNQEE